jgi:hypothetical protein
MKKQVDFAYGLKKPVDGPALSEPKPPGAPALRHRRDRFHDKQKQAPTGSDGVGAGFCRGAPHIYVHETFAARGGAALGLTNRVTNRRIFDTYRNISL